MLLSLNTQVKAKQYFSLDAWKTYVSTKSEKERHEKEFEGPHEDPSVFSAFDSLLQSK